MLIAVLGMSLNIMAGTTKTCKVSGGQDGATIVASIIEVGDGYVLVELDNDGNFAVNVTIKVQYNGSIYERSCKVSNQFSTTVKILIPNVQATTPMSRFSISTLTGSRCQ